MNFDNYKWDGQIELTEYLMSQIKCGKVMDLTKWINSHGKAQYEQIGEVVKGAYEKEKDSEDIVGMITNAVSKYVLEQSIGYMKYLTEQQ